MSLIKKYWFGFFILTTALWFYGSSLSSSFFQDDFFLLKMGIAQNPKDFVSFFAFQNDYGYTFYRPLTTQVYTFLTRSLFGLQPFFFHLLAFLIFLANLYLIFKIIRKLTKNELLSLMTVFLYSINASNLGSLAYISAFQEIGMAFFFFLTLWFYLRGSDKKALITFVLGLLSKETIVVLPLILVIYELFLGGKNLKKTFWFWAILAIYAFFRSSGGLPSISVYTPVFELNKIANGYFWYFLWGIGLPEILVDFVGPGLSFNTKFFLWYRHESLIFMGMILTFLPLLLFGILKLKKEEIGKIVFFFLFFLIGLLPVIFWPQHKFSFYLTVPLFGLVSIFAILLEKLPSFFRFLGLFLLFTVSLTTIKLSSKTYWVITRAKISQNLLRDLKQKYPKLPKGAILYFANDPKYPKISGFGNSSTQAAYVLSGSNAAQVIYDDQTIKVYYEDFEKPPFEVRPIFSMTAKISQE